MLGANITIYEVHDSQESELYLSEEEALTTAKELATALGCNWPEVFDEHGCYSFDEVKDAVSRGTKSMTNVDSEFLKNLLSVFDTRIEAIQQRYEEDREVFENDEAESVSEPADPEIKISKLFVKFVEIAEQHEVLKTLPKEDLELLATELVDRSKKARNTRRL